MSKICQCCNQMKLTVHQDGCCLDCWAQEQERVFQERDDMEILNERLDWVEGVLYDDDRRLFRQGGKNALARNRTR